ncbi:MAG: 7-cyano-7-deazaguanine synthase [Pirellulales bacterium]|nr:7-cyano-7-deazaguanine synthase [Pirellulales bacterium]
MSLPPPRGPLGVLVSGGLDSSILLANYLTNGIAVQPLYIRTGTVWQAAELAHLRRFLQRIADPRLAPLVCFEMPLADVYGGHWSMTGEAVPGAETSDEAVYLPGRNALLLLKASVWCQLNGIQQLALAPLAGNPFADATPEFFAAFQAMINLSASPPLSILRPFATLDKVQVMRLGRNFPLEETFSCIAPVRGNHCGQCNKCAERRLAFLSADLPDPTRYAGTSRLAQIR